MFLRFVEYIEYMRERQIIIQIVEADGRTVPFKDCDHTGRRNIGGYFAFGHENV